jgi:hypothetical protein
MDQVADKITCSTKPHMIVRPSGCTSFDQNVDLVGRKFSRVERNIQYNYGLPYGGAWNPGFPKDPNPNPDLDRGKYIKNCVGIPPPDNLDKHFLYASHNASYVSSKIPRSYLNDANLAVSGDNLVIDDGRVTLNEDSEQGMAIIVHCPPGCTPSSDELPEGNTFYSDNSTICMSAIHDGKIDANVGGFIQITLQRRAFIWEANMGFNNFHIGTLQNGVQSRNISRYEQRLFSIEKLIGRAHV